MSYGNINRSTTQALTSAEAGASLTEWSALTDGQAESNRGPIELRRRSTSARRIWAAVGLFDLGRNRKTPAKPHPNSFSQFVHLPVVHAGVHQTNYWQTGNLGSNHSPPRPCQSGLCHPALRCGTPRALERACDTRGARDMPAAAESSEESDTLLDHAEVLRKPQ